MIQTLLLLTGIAILFLVWNRANAAIFRDSASPFHLLLFGWFLPMSLRTLQLSELERPWSMRSLLLVGGASASMLVVSLVAAFAVRNAPFPKKRHHFDGLLQTLRVPTVRVLLIGIWAVVFLAYVYSEFVTNPARVPLLAPLLGWSSGSSYHRWGKETSWAIITPLLFILTPMLYLSGRSSSRRGYRWLLIGMALLYPLGGILKLSRSDVFIGMLNIAIVEYYFRRFHSMRLRLPKMNRTRWILLAVLAGAALYGSLILRGGIGFSTYAREIRFRYAGGAAVEASAQIYGYAALPFENLHQLMDSEPPGFRPGVSVLRPLYAMVGQGSEAEAKLADVHFKSISPAAGSQTFLSTIYLEFGIAGVLLVPFFYALLVNVLYVRARRRPGFLNLFLYLNFVYPWLWMYFNNAFSVLTFYLNAGFVVAMAMLLGLARRSRPHAGTTARSRAPAPEGDSGRMAPHFAGRG